MAVTILGAPPSGWVTSYANATDGTTIVGQMSGGANPQAGCFWTIASPTSAATAFTDLGGGGGASSVVGNLAVGYSYDGSSISWAVAFDVANPTNTPTTLGSITSQSGASALWTDGVIIVGYAWDASLTYAVMWDASNPTAAPAVLGHAITGFTAAYAYGVDGNNIAGYMDYNPGTGSLRVPVIWDASNPTANPTIYPIGANYGAGQGVRGDTLVGFDNNGTGYYGAVWQVSNSSASPTYLGLDIGTVTGGYAGNAGSGYVAGYIYGTATRAAYWALSDLSTTVVLPVPTGFDSTYAYNASGVWIVGEVDDNIGSNGFLAAIWDGPVIGHFFTADAVIIQPHFTANAVIKANVARTFTADAFVAFPTIKADAFIVGTGEQPHFPTRDHISEQADTFVMLDSTIGPYPAGTLLREVLLDLVSRVPGFEAAYNVLTGKGYPAATTSRNRHSRANDHFGFQALSDFVLSANIGTPPVIGSYAAGTSVATVLSDLFATLIGAGRSFTSDATMFRTISGSFSASAVIGHFGSITIDALIAGTRNRTFTMDAVISRTFKANAVLLKTRSSSFHADALIGGKGYFRADAVTKRLDLPLIGGNIVASARIVL